MKKAIFISLVLLLVCAVRASNSNRSKTNLNQEESIRNMLSIYKQNPQSYYVNIRLGYLYYSIKKYANAAHHYQRAAKSKSRSIEPLLGLYLVFASQGKYAKAKDYLQKVLRMDPNNYYGNYYLTYCLMYQQKYSSAKKIACKMLRLYPSDTKFLYALKNINLATKKKNDAEKIQKYINMLTQI